VIETERLHLRRMMIGDVDQLVALNAHPEVSRFIGSLDRERAIERLRSNERQWEQRGYGLLAILDRESGRFLGRSGLQYWPQFDETEVGWVLRPSVWGRGYATEAARACLAWGLRDIGLPYLTAMIRPDNERSIEVARRLGMKPARADDLGGLAVVVHVLRRDEWRVSGQPIMPPPPGAPARTPPPSFPP
jgi:RimJ/RimL family protein N-acetyltransferase